MHLEDRSQGIIRILDAKDLSISLSEMIEKGIIKPDQTCLADGDKGNKTAEQIKDFFRG